MAENKTKSSGRFALTPLASGRSFQGCARAVRVDVDMIRPTIMSARKTAEDTWAKVPPPVQTAAPYVGVAFLSAWLMNRIDQRTIRAQVLPPSLPPSLITRISRNVSMRSRNWKLWRYEGRMKLCSNRGRFM